jgi:hypothetical protein
VDQLLTKRGFDVRQSIKHKFYLKTSKPGTCYLRNIWQS